MNKMFSSYLTFCWKQNECAGGQRNWNSHLNYMHHQLEDGEHFPGYRDHQAAREERRDAIKSSGRRWKAPPKIGNIKRLRDVFVFRIFLRITRTFLLCFPLIYEELSSGNFGLWEKWCFQISVMLSIILLHYSSFFRTHYTSTCIYLF